MLGFLGLWPKLTAPTLEQPDSSVRCPWCNQLEGFEEEKSDPGAVVVPKAYSHGRVGPGEMLFRCNNASCNKLCVWNNASQSLQKVAS